MYIDATGMLSIVDGVVISPLYSVAVIFQTFDMPHNPLYS